MLQCKSLIYFNLLLCEMVSSKYYAYVIQGSRTIAPEENCLLTLILTLTLNQTLTLTRGQFSLRGSCPDTAFQVYPKNISNWYDTKKTVELYCKPIDIVFTWNTFYSNNYSNTLHLYQLYLKFVFKVVQTLKKGICY